MNIPVPDVSVVDPLESVAFADTVDLSHQLRHLACRDDYILLGVSGGESHHRFGDAFSGLPEALPRVAVVCHEYLQRPGG